MLKHTITYTDYDDEEVTEVLTFHFNKDELIELEVQHKEGLEAWLKTIIKANDRETIVREFKKIILLSYGEKSEDGRSFVKTDEIREAFRHTAAFSALFMQLSTDSDAAAAFIKGVIPKDLAKEVDKMQKEEAEKAAALAAYDAGPTE